MVSHQEISDMIQRIKKEPQENDLENCNSAAQKTARSKRKIEELEIHGQKRFRQLSIPCLMCDRYLENQDELMIHMALDHQCAPQANRRQVGRMPKHTCQICFAKFRTLRDLFTHTALHAKQLQINGEWASEIGERIDKNLAKQGAIRQYFSNLQNSLHNEVQHGTFRCDCCNNVFMNRDTYAMHVMMRVKDEMCKQDETLQKITAKDTSKDIIDLIPPPGGQETLVDVTTSVSEDEYLQTALSVTNTQQKDNDSQLNNLQGRKCLFCEEHFTDQDAMAMHVMSVHTTRTQQQAPTQRSVKELLAKRNGIERQPQTTVSVKEIYRCHVCGSVHESRNCLTKHVLAMHTGNCIRSTNHIEVEENVEETSSQLKCNGNDHFSKYDNQDEPLNLISGNKQDDEKTVKQKTNGTFEKLTENNLVSKHEQNVRRTRSASAIDIQEKQFQFISKNRPASTGGIMTGENRSRIEREINMDNGRSSPVCYSYEQPEPYIEDREHSCRYLSSQKHDPLELLLQKRENAHVCSYCEIIFLNRTLYYLHMGLHNVNNPLQCNMCGKVCDNIHDFSAHVMHL